MLNTDEWQLKLRVHHWQALARHRSCGQRNV